MTAPDHATATGVPEAEVEAAARELDPGIFRDIPHFVSPFGFTLADERNRVRHRAYHILAAAAAVRTPSPVEVELRAEIERLTRELNEAQREVVIAKAQRDEARDRGVRFQRSAEDSKKQNGTLYRRLNAMEGDLRDEQAALAAAQADAARMREDATALLAVLADRPAVGSATYVADVVEHQRRLSAAEASLRKHVGTLGDQP